MSRQGSANVFKHPKPLASSFGSRKNSEKVIQ